MSIEIDIQTTPEGGIDRVNLTQNDGGQIQMYGPNEDGGHLLTVVRGPDSMTFQLSRTEVKALLIHLTPVDQF